MQGKLSCPHNLSSWNGKRAHFSKGRWSRFWFLRDLWRRTAEGGCPYAIRGRSSRRESFHFQGCRGELGRQSTEKFGMMRKGREDCRKIGQKNKAPQTHLSLGTPVKQPSPKCCSRITLRLPQAGGNGTDGLFVWPSCAIRAERGDGRESARKAGFGQADRFFRNLQRS